MGIKILIVEDDAIIGLHLSGALESLGYTPVGTALSSVEAITMATQQQPDLALVDIGLRGSEDGVAVATTFRRKLDIPVIFLTAYTNPETVERARQAEPFGYISKPFDIRSLNATIEIALHRHRMERELKASEERYRFLFNNMYQGAMYLDAEMRIFSVNPAALAILGLSEEEMIGRYLFDPSWQCINEDGSPFNPNEFPAFKAMATRQPVMGAAMGVYNPLSQEYRWIRVGAVPIFKPGQDAPYQVFTTFDDITNLKQAETALEQNAARYMTLIEHLPDVISRFDRDLRYTYISPVVEKVLGVGPGGFLNKTSRELEIPPHIIALWEEKILKVFENGADQSVDYVVQLGTGTRAFESRLFPERGPDGTIQSVLSINRDVTELRIAYAVQQETERQLRTLFDNLIGMAYRCKNDPDWTLEFVSRGCEGLAGYSAQDLVEDRSISFGEIIHPADRPRVWETVQAALSAKQQYNILFRIITRSGETKWVEENGQGVFNSAGELEALEGFILDVSLRKHAEEALIENEAILRQILDNLPVAVRVTGVNGKIEYLNENFTRLFGYTQEDIPHLEDWYQAAYPDEDYRARMRTVWNDYLEEARLNSGETSTIEVHIISKDHIQHSVEVRATILQQRAITIYTDLTAIHAVEEDLQRSEVFMRQLLEEAPVAALVANLDRQIEFVNRQFSNQLGYHMADMENLDHWAQCVYPDAQERAAALDELEVATLNALREKHMLPVMEHCLTAKNGEVKNMRIRGSIIRGKLFMMFEDITFYREIENQLTANLAEKEALLREVYHRVKNNLQVVVSLLGLQAARIKDPAARELFIQSQNRIRSMALAHETLYRSAGFTRINFGGYLKDLIHDIRGSFAHQDNISVRVNADPIFMPIETAVPCGLIVNELVTNAYTYAFPNHQAGVIQVSFTSQGRQVLLEVRDNGVGLPEGLEPSNSETLGLNLVRILSLQINASIQISREYGTTFGLIFTIPEK